MTDSSNKPVQRRYTNNTGLSLFAQVFLATDYYSRGNADVSVTTLIKPTRQVILGGRVPAEASIIDVEAQIANRIGAAIHDGFERAWKRPKEELIQTMQELGHARGMVSRVRVNPTEEEVAAGGILPVYTEQRFFRKIAGVMVSGQADFIGDGAVEDLKNTSAYKFMSTDGDDYIKQGSMYRLLAPKIITRDYMNVTFHITDWSRAMARQQPDKYPAQRMLTKRFELMPLDQTFDWAVNRIGLLHTYQNAPEDSIPFCTDAELWRSSPVWKYYKKAADANTAGKRSTKNFDDEQSAMRRLYEDGAVGIVIKKPGEVKACKWCPGFHACTQKDALIASGDLVL